MQAAQQHRRPQPLPASSSSTCLVFHSDFHGHSLPFGTSPGLLMPPTGTEGESLTLALVPLAHVGRKREPAANLAPDQFFFSACVVFLQGPYEIEPGTTICPFLNACQGNHSAFSRPWRTDSYFPFPSTNMTFWTRVPPTPRPGGAAFISPASSFHFAGTAGKALGMRSVRPCLHQPGCEGCSRLKIFQLQNSASNMCSVSNEMLPCGSPCSLCWVNGWLSRDAAGESD